jgi:hypothetical protein
MHVGTCPNVLGYTSFLDSILREMLQPFRELNCLTMCNFFTGLMLLGHFRSCCLAVNYGCSAFPLHQSRLAFIDPLFAVGSCVRDCSPSKSFSIIQEQCFATTECLRMVWKIKKKKPHKCYTWGCPSMARNEDNIEHACLAYEWLSMKWQIVCKVVVVLSLCKIGPKTSYSVSYKHMYNCQQHVDCYGNEHDALLNRIITGDETWIQYCEPESKQQSMEWKHPQSPSKK